METQSKKFLRICHLISLYSVRIASDKRNKNTKASL